MSTTNNSTARFSPLTVSGFAHVLLLTYVIARTVRTTMDPDLFWHIRTGDVIVHDGIPGEDVFSFTVPGAEWITHEWLSQVLTWSVYSVAGLVGVALLFAFLGLICLTFVYRSMAGGPLLKAALTLFVFKVADISFGARFQLVTLTLAAVFVWLVQRVRRGEAEGKTLWTAVPLGLLWANLHAGFLLGVVIMATYAAGDYAQRRWFTPHEETLSTENTVQLAKVAATCFAVAIFNPSTWKLWMYPIATLRSDAMRIIISEWQSPDFHESTWYPFVGLLLGGTIIFALTNRKVTVTDLLLFCGTAAAGLSSLRHVALAAVVGVPVLSPHIVSAFRLTRLGPQISGESERKLTVNPIFMSVISVVLVLGGVAFALATLINNQRDVEEFYPIAAVDFIDSSGLADTPGYNSYRYGGYLIYTDHQVFIDGRADVYWDFLWEYRKISTGSAEWQSVADEYDLQWALVHPGEPIFRILDENPAWSEGYVDELVSVYVRDGE